MDLHDGFFGCISGTPASGMPVDIDDDPQVEETSGPLGVLPGVSDVSAAAGGDADDETPGDDLRGYRKGWACKRKMTAETEYSPSVIPDVFPPEPPTAGLAIVSSSSDDAAAFVNSFIDRMSPSKIVMPWENDFMAPIFGSEFASAKLSMPAQWSDTFVDPLKHAMPEAVPQAVQPVEFSIMKCVRNLADMDFIQSREKQMKQALLKLKCVLEIGWEFSGVGRLCIDVTGTPRADMEETLVSIVGTR
jgi:hypothetical protein